jgi:hypothetical protein
MDTNIENVLGYSAPSDEKPFTAYKKTLEWHNYSDIPENFRLIFEQIFEIS